MHRAIGLSLALMLGSIISRPALSQVWISVPDASQIQYQTWGDGKVYFRNLNQFDVNAQGCCYFYWIDTTNQEGKNIYALILSYIALGRALKIAVPTGYASGQLSAAGSW